MKYLLQVYLPKAWWEAQPAATRTAFAQACHAVLTTLAASSHLRAAQLLSDCATTLVHLRAGTLCVSDGPFAATEEYLVERYLVNARDLNHAIAMAAQLPQAQAGMIEVVPLRELS